MSYEIIYQKQFIKLSNDKFVPIIECGSNNCYEMNSSGKERRSRSWFNFSYILGGNLSGTLDEMLNNMNDELDRKTEEYSNREDEEKRSREQIANSWGHYVSLMCNTGFTFGQYLGIAKTGCKKALTVEQLADFGIVVRAYTYDSKEAEEKLEKLGLSAISEYPRTTLELEAIIDKYETLFRENDIHLYIDIGGSEWNVARIRKTLFPKNKKEMKIVSSTNGFTIQMENEGYFVGGSRRGYKYSPYKDGGDQYISEQGANAVARRLKKRGYEVKVLPVAYNSPRSFRVPV